MYREHRGEMRTDETGKKILIFIKYEYLGRGGDPYDELYDITATEQTTIKDLKKEINKSFLYGELDDEQYEIYKGGEQEDKEKNREPMKFYYKYIEPQILEDNNKTINDYNIIDGELLYLKAKLKLYLYIPTLRFTTIYLYTFETLEHIQNKVIEIYNSKNNIIQLKAEQITAFYGFKEIEKGDNISSYNIYDKSTIQAEINYNMN